jgi:hypothetical protein
MRIWRAIFLKLDIFVGFGYFFMLMDYCNCKIDYTEVKNLGLHASAITALRKIAPNNAPYRLTPP